MIYFLEDNYLILDNSNSRRVYFYVVIKSFGLI